MGQYTMSIGRLGDETTVFKRKFRWIFCLSDLAMNGPGTVITNSGGTVPGHICKLASRPQINFNSQQVKHLIEDIHLPAKAEWQPIQVKVFDLKETDQLYKWITTFYNPKLGTVNPSAQPTAFFGYPKKTATLQMLDGHGDIIENWILENCFPASVNWGDLDYNDSSICEIDIQLRYDRAIMNPRFTNNDQQQTDSFGTF